MTETVGGAVFATYGETVAGDFSVGIYYRLAATGRGELVGTAAVRVLADRVSALGSRFSLPQLDGSESGACAPRGVCGFSCSGRHPIGRQTPSGPPTASGYRSVRSDSSE